MAVFPITTKPSKSFFTQTSYKPQVLLKYESGSMQSRPCATVSKMKFTVGWEALSETDLQSLISHFNANIGTAFNWTHPTTETTYSVRYIEDQLPEAQYAGKNNSNADVWKIGPIALWEA